MRDKNITNQLIIGIDEFASETKKSAGWCFFCLPENAYKQFSFEANQILITSGKLKSFHGKRFNENQSEEYNKFLSLIKKYTESNFPSLRSSTLLSLKQKIAFDLYCRNQIEEYFKQVRPNELGLLKHYKPEASYLLLLLKVLQRFGRDYQFRLEIDNDSNKQNIIKKTKLFSEKQNYAEEIIYNFYNNYRVVSEYKDSPLLIKNGISFLSDTKSFAIQAADVMGHFSMAYLFHKLGEKSKKKNLKAKLFADCFGDSITEPILKKIKLSGNDIDISVFGSIDFDI
ncbi:MAG TPA: hypothetical protein VFI29_17340 [Hanamia sp.]|nr:hypothetical protein [Hanamia sp.]